MPVDKELEREVTKIDSLLDNKFQYHEKVMRSQKEWEELCRLAWEIILDESYLFEGNLRTNRKLASAISTSQEFDCLIKNLLRRYPELTTFSLERNSWTFVCWSEEFSKTRGFCEMKYGQISKPQYWVGDDQI